jgi:hypothetical protein
MDAGLISKFIAGQSTPVLAAELIAALSLLVLVSKMVGDAIWKQIQNDRTDIKGGIKNMNEGLGGLQQGIALLNSQQSLMLGNHLPHMQATLESIDRSLAVLVDRGK